MTQVAPMMTFKEWKGDASERFRHTDINRISGMVKALADMTSVPYEAFTSSRADMFDYGRQNGLESAIKQICSKLGIQAPMETDWSYGRSVSYADFDRVENWLWTAYRKLNGEGGRIPWDRERKFDPFTLYADNWTGTGPYFYELPTSFGAEYDEGLVFVRSEATAEQRFAEYNAIITVKSSASGVVLQANGAKPRENIPITITRGIPAMKEIKTLTADGWFGDGPWYQSATFTEEVADGVATISEATSAEQAREFAECGLSVSSVSGKQVSFRTVLKKPTMDLSVLLIYESSESV